MKRSRIPYYEIPLIVGILFLAMPFMSKAAASSRLARSNVAVKQSGQVSASNAVIVSIDSTSITAQTGTGSDAITWNISLPTMLSGKAPGQSQANRQLSPRGKNHPLSKASAAALSLAKAGDVINFTADLNKLTKNSRGRVDISGQSSIDVTLMSIVDRSRSKSSLH